MAEPKDESVAANHRDNLTANIHGTGDLVIELKYCKWAVHQKKFEEASVFFKKALEGGQWKEGREHYIKLHDDNPIDFARGIQFIYSGTYEYRARDGWFGYDTIPAEKHGLQYLLHGQPVYNIPGIKNSDVTENMAEIDLFQRIVEGVAGEQAERIEAAKTTTEKQADADKDTDVIANYENTPAQVDLEMYQLADKYGISSLQEFALSKVKNNIMPCFHGTPIYLTMFDAIKKAYPDLDFVDHSIKEAVSLGIASDYKQMSVRTDDAATGLREWLRTDHELCFMVMDRLGKGESLFKELGDEIRGTEEMCLCDSDVKWDDDQDEDDIISHSSFTV